MYGDMFKTSTEQKWGRIEHKGLWQIAEDSANSPSDRTRAYSLIIQCNSKKNQSTTIARTLFQWLDEAEEALRKKRMGFAI